jgi:hypothetical protein
MLTAPDARGCLREAPSLGDGDEGTQQFKVKDFVHGAISISNNLLQIYSFDWCRCICKGAAKLDWRLECQRRSPADPQR